MSARRARKKRTPPSTATRLAPRIETSNERGFFRVGLLAPEAARKRGGIVKARRRKGRTRPSTVTRPAAPCQRGHIDIDLLLEARQKAFLLVLATDGLMCGDAEYIYETFSENEALSLLVHEVSEALAELGKQAEGKAEPEAAAVAS